jgi:hypothetical protein
MSKTSRGWYWSHLSRIYTHLDWYLKESFETASSVELAMSDILADLQTCSGVKIRRETVLRYNANQFSRYQTAPIEWIGADTFRLNQNYYRLLDEKVFAPRIGIRGPPKKYTQGEKELDNQS